MPPAPHQHQRHYKGRAARAAQQTRFAFCCPQETKKMHTNLYVGGKRFLFSLSVLLFFIFIFQHVPFLVPEIWLLLQEAWVISQFLPLYFISKIQQIFKLVFSQWWFSFSSDHCVFYWTRHSLFRRWPLVALLALYHSSQQYVLYKLLTSEISLLTTT